MAVILAVIQLVATAALLVALVALHLAPTGLSAVTAPVSQYALTRFRAGYTTAAASAAVAAAAAALFLAPLAEAAAVVVLLWVFAVARALIPFFPMDAPGAQRTRSGGIHSVLALVAFVTVTLAAIGAAAPLRDAGYPALAPLTRICAAVMVLGSIGTMAAGRVAALRPVFGLVERLIYVGFIAWFGILSIAFLLHPGIPA